MLIKGFDKDLKCRGFQFEVGQVYEVEGAPKLCSNGFHYCDNIADVHNFYDLTKSKGNRFCEIEALGEIDKGHNKLCTNKIKIIREIVGEGLDSLINFGKDNTGILNTGDMNTGDKNAGHKNAGHKNTGDMNTGYRNTGNMNTGYWNAGHKNTGNMNTGYKNTGDKNTGYWNTGYWNAGHKNTGDMNTGDMNTGDMNTGDKNTGDKNAGHKNTGDMNTGDKNAGNMNTGYWNAGHKNTGDKNAGHMNTGYWNTGNMNTGGFNSCNFSNGFFCTQEPTINIFNMPTSLTLSEFYESNYYDAITNGDFKLTEWISYSEEEKANDETKKNIGGYLKKYTYKEACANWWNSLDDENKDIIKSIPNFNADIFKEITGIDV